MRGMTFIPDKMKPDRAEKVTSVIKDICHYAVFGIWTFGIWSFGIWSFSIWLSDVVKFGNLSFDVWSFDVSTL
jgi:hypothetical protein